MGSAKNTLIKHPDFTLPGRKALLISDMGYKVMLIDGTEATIDRPKKSKEYKAYQVTNKGNFIQERHTLKTAVDNKTKQLI